VFDRSMKYYTKGVYIPVPLTSSSKRYGEALHSL